MKPLGYVHADGKRIVDGEGRNLVLKGVNFGNWFVQEFWMASSYLGSFRKKEIYTQKRARKAMEENPNLQKEDIRKLEGIYLDNFIQEGDFQRVHDLGLNTIRINFSVYNLTDDGENVIPEGFSKLDWALDMAEKHDLYVVLDLHGAIGSQNMDHHSGNDEEFDLFPNRVNRQKTIHLWEQIAEHFKERTVVCGYDLLNEPRRKKHRYTGKVCFDFYAELYHAVRKIDRNHMIFLECFSFPNNGRNPKAYGFKNVCYEYHIYNLTPFPQKICLEVYRLLDKWQHYDVPVYIGEWNAWGKEKDWMATFDFFDSLGWSYTSWTYKVNRYPGDCGVDVKRGNWGLLELDLKPADIRKGTFEEIASVYSKTGSAFAKETNVLRIYEKRFGRK